MLVRRGCAAGATVIGPFSEAAQSRGLQGNIVICAVGALQGLVTGAWRLYPNLMRTLFHFPLDPNCRIIRLMLGEKRLDFRSAAPTMATPDAPVMEIPTFEDENGAQMPYLPRHTAVVSRASSHSLPPP